MKQRIMPFMLKSDLYIWLVPYLEGELDAERAAILEKRLAADPKLSAEAERLRAHLRLIRAAAASAPQREAEYSVWPKVQAQLRAHPSQNTWTSPFTVLAGAAAVLLIGVAVARPWDRPSQQDSAPIRVASNRQPVDSGVVDVPNVNGLREKIGNAISNAIVKKPEPIKPVSVEALRPRKSSPGELARPGEFGYVPDMGGSNGSDPFAYKTASSQTPGGAHHPRPLSAAYGTRMAASRNTYATTAMDSASNAPVTMSGDTVDSMRTTLNKDGAYENLVNAGMPASPGGMALTPPPPPSVATATPQPVHTAPGGMGSGQLQSRTGFGNKLTTTPAGYLTKNPSDGGHESVSDSVKIGNLLNQAKTAANNQKTSVAMDTWRDVLMFELQTPTYGDETATTQAEAILRSIRQTGNLMPFRAYVEHQVGPTPDEVADWRILALLYAQQGLNEQAESVWRYITGTNEATGEDWYQLGLVRQKLGNASGARVAFTTAMGSLPSSSAHYHNAEEAVMIQR